MFNIFLFCFDKFTDLRVLLCLCDYDYTACVYKLTGISLAPESREEEEEEEEEE